MIEYSDLHELAYILWNDYPDMIQDIIDDEVSNIESIFDDEKSKLENSMPMGISFIDVDFFNDGYNYYAKPDPNGYNTDDNMIESIDNITFDINIHSIPCTASIELEIGYDDEYDIWYNIYDLNLNFSDQNMISHLYSEWFDGQKSNYEALSKLEMECVALLTNETDFSDDGSSEFWSIVSEIHNAIEEKIDALSIEINDVNSEYIYLIDETVNKLNSIDSDTIYNVLKNMSESEIENLIE